MTITLVAETESQDTSGGTTTDAIDTTGADLLVLVLISLASTTEPTVSDNKGNTWSQRTAYSNPSARTRIYYAVNPTVGSGHTFAATGTSSFAAIAVSAYSGCDTSAPADQENGGTFSNVNSTTTGSVTPTEDGELLVAGFGFQQAGHPGGVSIDSGFSVDGTLANINGVAFGVVHAHKIQVSAGAENPQLSWSINGSGSMAIATFKAAGANNSVLLPFMMHMHG